jgi:hypothetical protein
MKQIQT